MRDASVVLCYHKVGPQAEVGRWLSLEPESLRLQIRFLRRRGYRIAPARDLADYRTTRLACLTFDDAYQCFVDYGLPVLDSENAPSSIYVVSGEVGGASNWDGERAAPLAKLDALHAARAAGHELGNHTANHRFLGQLSQEEQIVEIATCHTWMQRQGWTPESFCLPYGSHNEATAGLIEGQGYAVGLTTRPGFVTGQTDRRICPRIGVSYSDGVAGLWYKLTVKAWIKGYGPGKPHR